MKQNNRPILVPLTTAILLALGCSDDRAVQLSREAADRQAAQNREMAQLNREITTSHRDLTELQQNVHAERSELNSGWGALEAERRLIAGERRTGSFLAVLVPVAGSVVVIVAALYFAGMLLRSAGSTDAVEAELSELLVRELAADEPMLLPRRPVSGNLITHIPEEENSLESHCDDPNPDP